MDMTCQMHNTKAVASLTSRQDDTWQAKCEDSRYVQCQPQPAGSWIRCGRQSPFCEQSHEHFSQSTFRNLAFFSLSVDSTEQRLLRSHLELFSRVHLWGPRATIPSFLAASPGSSSSLWKKKEKKKKKKKKKRGEKKKKKKKKKK